MGVCYTWLHPNRFHQKKKSSVTHFSTWLNFYLYTLNFLVRMANSILEWRECMCMPISPCKGIYCSLYSTGSHLSPLKLMSNISIHYKDILSNSFRSAFRIKFFYSLSLSISILYLTVSGYSNKQAMLKCRILFAHCESRFQIWMGQQTNPCQVISKLANHQTKHR